MNIPMAMFAAVLAYFVKGLCGFANTLVFTSVLSFTNDNINISPVELMIGFPANVVMAFKERKYIKWKMCAMLACLVLAGSLPGIFFLKNVDTGSIKKLFGLVIIIVGLQMLLQDLRPSGQKKQSKIVLVFIGVLSGILCGLYGIGALLSAYISKVTDDMHGFKANMSMVFLVENVFRLTVYAILGILTWSRVKQAAMVIPFMLFGLWAGMFSSKFIREKLVKRLVMVLLILSGVMTVLR